MKELKIRQLFDSTMPVGGLPAFRTAWEQSLGLHYGDNGCMALDTNKREINHNEMHLGRLMTGLLGPNWKNTFEQQWQRASRLRFEGIGGPVLSGDLAYVSAAVDVIAGLANARALERPKHSKWLFDKMAKVVEIPGEGGFDIIVRSSGDKPNRDLGETQMLPTATLKGSRVHRNRTLNQGLRTEISLSVVLNDLTGTLYDAVDENSDQVLLEREQKLADCLMGVSAGTGAKNTYALTVSAVPNIGVDGLAIPMVQDGLSFLPWQNGYYGSNVNATIASPENQRLIANFANCADTDGKGLTDYTAFVRALQMLAANRDPFTNLPPDIEALEGMTILCAPAARVQIEYMLQATSLWQIANGAGVTTGLSGAGSNTVSENVLKEVLKNARVETSQVWFNRLVDVGLASVSSGGTYSIKSFTNAASDTYTTAGSIMSTFFLGKFQDAVHYAQRMPYTVEQVPLSSLEYGRQIVMVQDVRERGQAYWVNPRVAYRAFA